MTLIENLYQHFKKHPVVCTDSRNIIPGSIFFALKGPSFNGNSFAAAALQQGAAFAVIEEAEFDNDSRCLLVSDVLETLQQLANFHRRQLKIPFIAITGSNGKTTTKELIRSVLSKKFITHATKGNLNNHIGVPLTILSIKDDVQFAVIEMGANHLHEIESYCKIVEPDYGLITNVGKAHLEGFGGFEGVKKGKGELYEWISKRGKEAFINSDNEFLQEMATTAKLSRLITYGKDADYFCSGKLITEQPVLEIKWNCNETESAAISKLVGSYNFENILSAICVGNFFQVSPDDINDAISEYIPDNSRSQILKKGNNTIILDAYNANPTSMEAALNNFAKISSDNKIVFIGDMAELGESSSEEHLRIASMLNNKKYSQIVFVGKNFGQFSEKLNGLHFDDSGEAAKWLQQHPVANAFILIKGSRSTKMEKILESL